MATASTLDQSLSLYLHIPFCHTRCPYCDFNTYARIESLIPEYTEALSMELRLWGQVLGHPQVHTVFFGGGTPSYLPSAALDQLLAACRNAFRLAPETEVTVEANPGDQNRERLEHLLRLGVNRLSIGVQSLDDGLLKLLGRRHSAREAVNSYRLARAAGFRRVNLDLMYGIPTQSMEQWRATLDRVLALDPPHLSLYCLTLEQGTPMEQWVGESRLAAPDSDLAAEMYQWAEEVLEGAGYHHYEISNWAQPGQECRHNLTYWLNRPYLGVGAGAHSFLGGYRFSDVRPPRLYTQRVRKWAARGVHRLTSLDEETLLRLGPVEGVERIGRGLEMAETVFLGLRLVDGLDLVTFQGRFGEDPLVRYRSQVEKLQGLGLLEHADGLLRLTPRGRLLANQVFVEFLG